MNLVELQTKGNLMGPKGEVRKTFLNKSMEKEKRKIVKDAVGGCGKGGPGVIGKIKDTVSRAAANTKGVYDTIKYTAKAAEADSDQRVLRKVNQMKGAGLRFGGFNPTGKDDLNKDRFFSAAGFIKEKYTKRAKEGKSTN